jgi:hypothetical protein
MAAYKGKVLDVLELTLRGETPEIIAEKLGLTIEEVKEVIENYS